MAEAERARRRWRAGAAVAIVARRLDGYVYNSYGRPAENVQVLVQALDASGAVIDQRLAWVPGGVPQLSRASFEVP
jgi:hypothetical protein